jgi:hypothetical protein
MSEAGIAEVPIARTFPAWIRSDSADPAALERFAHDHFGLA